MEGSKAGTGSCERERGCDRRGTTKLGAGHRQAFGGRVELAVTKLFGCGGQDCTSLQGLPKRGRCAQPSLSGPEAAKTRMGAARPLATGRLGRGAAGATP